MGFIFLMLGISLGGAVAMVLRLSGLAERRATGPILLAVIALFYPVFALLDGMTQQVAIHGAVFAAFAILAILGYQRSAALIAVGLIVHGIFDVFLGSFTGAPGPIWWPPFCSGFDISIGCWWFFRRPT